MDTSSEPNASIRVDSSASPAPRGRVLVVGPPVQAMGGMAAVVAQTLSLAYEGRYALEHLPTTHAENDHETILGKVSRHRRQVETLERSVRRFASSIVHIHTCSGFSFYRSLIDLLIARHLGCRVVLHVHGAAFNEFYERSPFGRQRIIGWGLRQADRVIALSETWRDTIAAMAPDASITVIENAVELPVLSCDPLTRADAPCHFVVLARMDVWKGIDDALDAAAVLAARRVVFHLTLAGPEGSSGDAAAMNEKIASRGLERRVSYVGPVEGTAKAHLLESADAYLMPSHHEGLPISVLEAVAHGLPVVATTVGAIPDVLEDGVHGLLVPPREPPVLAAAMAALAADSVRRRSMGSAARRLAQTRFGLERFERDLLGVYDGLLDPRTVNQRVLKSATAPRGPSIEHVERKMPAMAD